VLFYRDSRKVRTLNVPTIREPIIIPIFINPPAEPNGTPTNMLARKTKRIIHEITKEIMQRILGM
jgi:hypothetical protein